MTVQIVEIAGEKIVVLSFGDYQQLLSLAEDRDDIRAASEAARRRDNGEEYLPAEMVDMLIAGQESALRLWRKHRGMKQKDLAEAVGVSIAHISDIEQGKNRGRPQLWRLLAEALAVSADDILPAA